MNDSHGIMLFLSVLNTVNKKQYLNWYQNNWNQALRHTMVITPTSFESFVKLNKNYF